MASRQLLERLRKLGLACTPRGLVALVDPLLLRLGRGTQLLLFLQVLLLHVLAGLLLVAAAGKVEAGEVGPLGRCHRRRVMSATAQSPNSGPQHGACCFFCYTFARRSTFPRSRALASPMDSSRAQTPRRVQTPRSIQTTTATEPPAGRQLFLHRHGSASFDTAAAPYDTVSKFVAGRAVNSQLTQPTGTGVYATWQSAKDRYIPMSSAVGDHISQPGLTLRSRAELAAGPRPSYSDKPDSALNPYRFGRPADAARYASEAYIHPQFGHLTPWPSPRAAWNAKASAGQAVGPVSPGRHATQASLALLRPSSSRSLNKQHLSATKKCWPTGGSGGSPRWPAASPLSSPVMSARPAYCRAAAR